MLFAIFTIVGLASFFYLIIRLIPKASNHISETVTGLKPNLERAFGQLSSENFKTLTKQKKAFAVIEVIYQIICLSIAAILIYSLF